MLIPSHTLLRLGFFRLELLDLDTDTGGLPGRMRFLCSAALLLSALLQFATELCGLPRKVWSMSSRMGTLLVVLVWVYFPTPTPVIVGV